VRLYDALGVSTDATQAEIKRAYKRLAMQLHPDRPNGDADTFLPIQAAYDVLSDESKRRRYDETGDVEDRRFEDLVTDKMMQLFNGMLSEEQNVIGDAVEQMRGMIEKGINGTMHNQNKVEAKKTQLKKRRNRIKITQGHGANLYKQLADAAITSCDQQIAQLEEEINLLNEVLHRIDWYEDVEPVGGGIHVYMYQSGTTTSGMP
tara:strand:+ start:2267 stop:2881 length:615 start_codon:yes stop_codon:yes gene_type:complete